ncbi:MAG: Uma2 family endonuclease [Rubrobacter sp.]|nr:Uma2 family endonuclease [Rubrobacter sp.]
MADTVAEQDRAAARVGKRLFTADEYHRMAEAGILDEDDRVELIEGEVLEMSPVGSRHAACVNRFNSLFNRQVTDKAIVGVQNPVRLDEHSEPEPDLALLRPREDFYSGDHPAPGDVLLLVEVAETSAEYDSAVKLPLYARAGIPEVWLVNLPDESIELHHRAASGEYRETLRAKRGERLASKTVPELEVAVGDVLG